MRNAKKSRTVNKEKKKMRGEKKIQQFFSDIDTSEILCGRRACAYLQKLLLCCT